MGAGVLRTLVWPVHGNRCTANCLDGAGSMGTGISRTVRLELVPPGGLPQTVRLEPVPVGTGVPWTLVWLELLPLGTSVPQTVQLELVSQGDWYTMNKHSGSASHGNRSSKSTGSARAGSYRSQCTVNRTFVPGASSSGKEGSSVSKSHSAGADPKGQCTADRQSGGSSGNQTHTGRSHVPPVSPERVTAKNETSRADPSPSRVEVSGVTSPARACSLQIKCTGNKPDRLPGMDRTGGPMVPCAHGDMGFHGRRHHWYQIIC